MFSSDKWFGASPSFYNGVATQSARFNSGSSANLSKTPDASDRKVWTWSAWVKRSSLSASRAIWSVTSSAHFAIFFNSDDSLRVWVNGGNGAIYTNRLFRDTNAWYHIALTSKNSGNYFELYINGVKETSFSYDNRSNYPGSSDTEVNSNAVHYLGAWNNGGLQYFDGYLADVNFLDGITVGDTGGILDEFIEIKNGVCIPKAYSGSYGTNGYRLEFTGFLGTDTSGNDPANNYTPSGFSADDTNFPDCPENNFCTMNFLDKGSASTLSEGNLKTQQTADDVTTSTFHFDIATAKHYAEFYIVSTAGLSTAIGITESGIASSIKDASGGNSGNYWYNANGQTRHTSYVNYGDTWTAGDIISIRIDEGSVYFYKNGTIQNSGTAAFSSLTGIYTISVGEYSGTNIQIIANFGQDGSFAGTLTGSDVGDEKDTNGNGQFKYAVPSSHLALCSANLPEPTIGPNSDTQSDDHFNALLYTGNGSTQSITGVGFQPDLTWSKDKENGVRNVLTDSSRGVHLDFFSDINYESNDTAGVTAFNADGFSLGSSTNHNVSSRIYVSWNWKANGGTTTTNDASATGVGSIDSVHQADTTAGFSIVTYTGSASSANNGTASTVAHGLGAIPKWIWLLPRDTYDGCVYHAGVASDPATDRLLLKTSSTSDSATAASDSNEFFNDTEPTSTVFSIGTRKHANSSGGMVAYCWAEVEGYSKFGSYIGNGSADGPFVYLGFKPSFLMIKRAVGGTGNWIIYDDARDPNNETSRDYLYGNLANAQGTDGKVDFLSNGFKQRSPSSYTDDNASGSTYIYMAFAEAPFKYANAR